MDQNIFHFRWKGSIEQKIYTHIPVSVRAHIYVYLFSLFFVGSNGRALINRIRI